MVELQPTSSLRGLDDEQIPAFDTGLYPAEWIPYQYFRKRTGSGVH